MCDVYLGIFGKCQLKLLLQPTELSTRVFFTSRQVIGRVVQISVQHNHLMMNDSNS
jgi:hypothetical protein